MASVVVTGEVSRVFFDGKGAEVVESWTAKGKPMTRRWTAWFQEPHGMSAGDTATVSGLYSDEISEWDKDGETRRNVKRSLNNAKVLPSRDEGDAPQPAGGFDNSETPF